MIEDDVLRGVREAREAYAKLFNYDIEAMAEDLRRQDEAGDWPVVRLEPRRPAGFEARPDGTGPGSQSIETEPSGSDQD